MEKFCRKFFAVINDYKIRVHKFFLYIINYGNDLTQKIDVEMNRLEIFTNYSMCVFIICFTPLKDDDPETKKMQVVTECVRAWEGEGYSDFGDADT